MEYNVSSGRTSSGITLGADDTMTIFSKGIASKTTVVSGGSMLVKTGGSAVVTTLNDGLMDTESAAYIQSLTIGSEGVLYLSARVSVVNPIVLSSGGVVHVFSGGGSGVTYNMKNGGQVFVHSGGVFESTNVKDGASAVIISGATATSTTCIYSGNLILSGGTAINTEVYSRGVLMVSRGGVAQDVIVTSDGTANVSGLISGGKVYGASATINCLYRGCVSAVTVSWNGIINANSGGVVSDCVVDTRGKLNLSDGGRIYGATVNSGGYCHVFSGGTANSVTVSSGGQLLISSGGTANFTTVNNQGSMFVSDGGKAHSTTVNLGGRLDISSGGVVNFTTVYSSGHMWVSSGGTVSGTTTYGSMCVYRGGSAVSTTVGSGGDVDGQFGAFFDHTTILSGGRMNFSGTASNTTVSSGARFILGDGFAFHTVVLAGGRMYILSGGRAKDTTIYAGVSFTNEGKASNTSVFSGGKLYVDGASGGSAFETTLAYGGSMYISSGLASNTTVCSGASMSALQARVDDTTVDGIMEVRSGRVISTTVNSGGTMYLYYDADAYNVTVNSGGELYLSEGIILHSTTVRSGGSMVVVKWGVSATDNTVIDGGVLEVLSGGTMTAQAVASNLTARNGGTIAIDSGGTLCGAVAGENGLVTVQNGATASNLVLSSGGVLNVSSGGLVKTATVNAGGVVTGVLRKATGLTFSGGTLDFDISNTAPSGEYIVDSATTLFTNDGISWTLTVNDSQANGTYNLMEDAYSYSKSITAENPFTVKGTDGATLGTLTVGGTAEIDGATYALKMSNDYRLTVTISGDTPPTPPEPPTPSGTAKSDIDGNGISDVMFVWTGTKEQPGNYQHGYWMNGTNEWQSQNGGHPADWENLGCYDMSGDGNADSVLVGNVVVNDVKGAYIGYYEDAIDNPDGSTWVNIGYLNNADDYIWKNKVGNLTGGSANSIVWHTSDLGALGAWIDGTDTWVSIGGGYDSNWTLIGCGDFDGDGADSVLMCYNSGEKYYAVDLDGTAFELANSDSGWEVRAIGDFFGDGYDDIVAFHAETGLVAMWEDGDSTLWSQLGQLDAKDWFVVGAGDYDGDAEDDLLVRQNSTGMLGYYSSGDMSKWNTLGYGVDMSWTVIA